MVVILVVRLLNYRDFTTKMARIIKPLTTKEVKDADIRSKEYRLYDGDSLLISIRPSGKKVWLFNYTNSDGKRTLHTIGEFPVLSLVDARKEKDLLKQRLASGKAVDDTGEITFSEVFYEWLEKWRSMIVEKTYTHYKSNVERYCFPVLSKKPISTITPRDIVRSLDEMEDRRIISSLLKTKSALKQTFDYAIARGLCDVNPVSQVSNNNFYKKSKKNHRSLRPDQLYILTKFLKSERNSVITKCALEFTLLTLARASEVTESTWQEIDFENKLWIPDVSRMKNREEHYVPLTNRMIEILKEMEPLRTTDYIFPSFDLKSHITSETMRAALVRSRIETTVHGFRHLASTILNESSLFHPSVIESCLAHTDKDSIRATYNKAQYIERRRTVLEWWSDFVAMCDTEENNKKALDKFGIIVM